mgnify:CR=1 FL=1
MLDAHTLGVITRNFSSIINLDEKILMQVSAIHKKILARNCAQDVMGCRLMIALKLKNL